MSAVSIRGLPRTPERAAVRPLAFRQRPWACWVLLGSDVAALEAALLCGLLLRRALARFWPIALGPEQYHGLAVGVLVLPIAYYLLGLYSAFGLSVVERLRRQVQATVAVFAALIAWDYLVQHGTWSRGILLGAAACAMILLPATAGAARGALIRAGCWGTPIVVLGAARTGALIVKTLRREPALGLVPVAVFDDDRGKWGSFISGVPVMGSLSYAAELRGAIRVALVAMPGLSRERVISLVDELRFPHVVVIPDLFGMQTLWVTAKDLGGVLGLELRNNLLLRHNRILKRMLDVAIALPLLVLSLPLSSVLALWIRRAARSSAFYCQGRAGRGSTMVRVWKLRTMRADAPVLLERHLAENAEDRRHWERFFKLKKDPRILPGIGHWLRRSSLDELPQLWNVLKGEMSLVGPRPLPEYQLGLFRDRFRELRQSVLPGMTGLWQVTARSNGDLGLHEALDTYYIRNWSLWLDLYLIGRTVRAVLSGKGAY